MVTIARQTNGPNWSNILTDSVVIDQNIQIRVHWKGLYYHCQHCCFVCSFFRRILNVIVSSVLRIGWSEIMNGQCVRMTLSLVLRKQYYSRH